jgi:hypothetical protein
MYFGSSGENLTLGAHRRGGKKRREYAVHRQFAITRLRTFDMPVSSIVP